MSDEQELFQAVENEVRNDFLGFDAFTHRKDHTAAAVLALARQIALLRRELAQRAAVPPRKRAVKTKPAGS